MIYLCILYLWVVTSLLYEDPWRFGDTADGTGDGTKDGTNNKDTPSSGDNWAPHRKNVTKFFFLYFFFTFLILMN